MARKRRQPRIARVTSNESKGHALAYPAGVAERYRARLRAMIGQMAAATIAEIKRSYPEPVAEDAAIGGVVVSMDADIPGPMNSALDGILSRFQKMFDSQAPKISGKMVAEADKASTSAVKSSLKEASSNVVVPTTVLQSGEIADVWKASVAENVDLIKSVPGQYMQRIKDQVQDGITKGRGIADLLPELQNIQGMSDRRAKLIAYDQTRKAYASYNLTKLTGAGVKKFEWLHSGGAAEPRKDHIAMSGNVYRFDDPPVIDQRTGERGFPGQAINCSCRMLPVVDENDTAPVEQEAPQIEIRQTEAESHSAEIAAREIPSVVEKPALRAQRTEAERDADFERLISSGYHAAELKKAHHGIQVLEEVDKDYIVRKDLRGTDLEGLPPKDQAAIHYYSKDGYYANRAVMSSTPDDYFREGEKDDHLRFIDYVTGSLDKAKKYKSDDWLFRGEIHNQKSLASRVAEFEEAFMSGGPVVNKGILSTAKESKAAFDGKLKIMIKPNGYKGVDIEKIANIEKEREVAFGAGARFKVVNINKNGDPSNPLNVEVWLEEIEPE